MCDFCDYDPSDIAVDDNGFPVYDWDDDDDPLANELGPINWDVYEAIMREERSWEIEKAWVLHANPYFDDPYNTYFEVMSRMDTVGDDEDPMAQRDAWLASLEIAQRSAVNPRAVAAWQRHLRRGRSRTSPYADAAWVAAMSA